MNLTWPFLRQICHGETHSLLNLCVFPSQTCTPREAATHTHTHTVLYIRLKLSLSALQHSSFSYRVNKGNTDGEGEQDRSMSPKQKYSTFLSGCWFVLVHWWRDVCVPVLQKPHIPVLVFYIWRSIRLTQFVILSVPFFSLPPIRCSAVELFILRTVTNTLSLQKWTLGSWVKVCVQI